MCPVTLGKKKGVTPRFLYYREFFRTPQETTKIPRPSPLVLHELKSLDSRPSPTSPTQDTYKMLIWVYQIWYSMSNKFVLVPTGENGFFVTLPWEPPVPRETPRVVIRSLWSSLSLYQGPS